MPKHYDYKIAEGWESKAGLTDLLPKQEKRTIEVQRVIIKRERIPAQAIGFRKGYPAWKEISHMELWTDNEFHEFYNILIEHGFVQNTDLPDGSMQFSWINL